MGIRDLPLDTGKRIYKVFEKIGFEFRGRSEKSHFILQRPNDPYLFISIPDHPEIDRKTLKAEVRKTGLTDKQFYGHYEELYESHPATKTCEVVEMEATCVLCHETIEQGHEKVIQESGLFAHRECHDRQFGTA